MSLVDPADHPPFTHPMVGVAEGFTRRHPKYEAGVDEHGGVYAVESNRFGLGGLSMDIPSLEEFREWGEEQRDPQLREDAVATANRLLELCDWRWYAWRALQPGVVRRLDEDGLYAVRVELGDYEEDIFESANRAEATEEWLRLARMVAIGEIDDYALRRLLSDEDLHMLSEAGKLPPGLMRVWRDNQAAE